MGKFEAGNVYAFKPGNTAAQKYSPEMCEKLIEYFESNITPTFAGACVKVLGVLERTALNWIKSHPEFEEAWEACKHIQKDKLINGGLTERFNPAFSKYMLGCVHGMHEQSDLNIGGASDAQRKLTVSITVVGQDHAGT